MRIFVILSRIPYPINKGDKLRAYQQIKLLSLHHEIFLFALSDERMDQKLAKEKLNFCKKIIFHRLYLWTVVFNLFRSLFSRLPFQVSYFFSQKIKSKLELEIKNFKPDIIFCQLIRTCEYISGIQGIPTVIDYIDVLSKGLERRLRSANYFLKPLIYSEYKRVMNYEKKVNDSFDEKIIITQNDRDLLPFPGNEKVRIIPNCVDTEYFVPMSSPKDYDIIFTGNLSYPPNVQAAVTLVNNILPALLTKKNDIKVLIVGSSPSSRVKKLVSENVEVRGWVEDIRDCYARAKVFVAPMQIGTGMQNKLLEAMAMRIPCVTSALAQSGIQAPVNQCLLIGDSPEEYAAHILTLLENDDLADKIAEEGCKFVNENYNWAAISFQLEELFVQANTDYLKAKGRLYV